MQLHCIGGRFNFLLRRTESSSFYSLFVNLSLSLLTSALLSLSNLPSLYFFFSLCQSVSQSSNFYPSLSNLPSLYLFFFLFQCVSVSLFLPLSLFLLLSTSILICQCVYFLIPFKISVNLNFFLLFLSFSLFSFAIVMHNM